MRSIAEASIATKDCPVDASSSSLGGLIESDADVVTSDCSLLGNENGANSSAPRRQSGFASCSAVKIDSPVTSCVGSHSPFSTRAKPAIFKVTAPSAKSMDDDVRVVKVSWSAQSVVGTPSWVTTRFSGTSNSHNEVSSTPAKSGVS